LNKCRSVRDRPEGGGGKDKEDEQLDGKKTRVLALEVALANEAKRAAAAQYRSPWDATENCFDVRSSHTSGVNEKLRQVM
jgi:hypothetical protein